MTAPRPLLAALVLTLALAACGSEQATDAPADETTGPADAAGTAPGDDEDPAPYSGIGASETVRFLGNEPFWGGEASGDKLIYKTPENIDGTTIEIERFAGRNGLSLSGDIEDAPFDMAITPGECSDGMSDRTYPFTVTLQVSGEQRSGCAWTESKPFSGPEHP